MRLLNKMILLISLATLTACASLPDNSQRPLSYTLEEDKKSSLSQSFHQQGQPSDKSAYLLLDDGLDAFVARALLANEAEQSIDVQYYMLHDDEVGNLFIDQLVMAADRGVRIRLLLDDIDEGHRDFSLSILNFHSNISVRIFNPFGRNVARLPQYRTGFGKQTRRAHNKSFTVDNIATIIGGRNIGDEYFSADPKLEFQDLDILALGPVAKQVSSSFDLYWNNSLNYPISSLVSKSVTKQDFILAKNKFDLSIAHYENSKYLQRLENSSLANDFRSETIKYYWGTGEIYADLPEKLSTSTSNTEHHIFDDLLPYMAKAKKDLLILSPYFVPGSSGVAFLTDLAKKGVRVRILTNSLSSTDVSIVHAGYSRYRRALLQGGIELYELNKKTSKEDRKEKSEGRLGHSKSSLHAKAFVVDEQDVFIGSLNFDQRSVIQNTEIGLVLQSSEVAKIIYDTFENDHLKSTFRLSLEKADNNVEYIRWKGFVDGEEVTYKKEPFTSFWRRLTTGIMRFMPIESQI